jgi:probable HAF family extracellular repeat protein
MSFHAFFCRSTEPLPALYAVMAFVVAGALSSVAVVTVPAKAAGPIMARAATLQRTPFRGYQRHRVRYILEDLGTFGGPASEFINGFDGFLNDRGTAAGWSDTSMSDPYPSYCFNPNCYVSHAFRWQDGKVTDLGVLPGGASSQAFWTSADGLILGNSQNGMIDPLIYGFPENRAVVWRGGRIIDLGTLEGGYEALGSSVNRRGQAVGLSLNTVYDQYSFFAPLAPYQTRAFLWNAGTMQDLGTLGGPDAIALFVNEGGRISGQSYINSMPNPTTGIPTIDPFLWYRSHGQGTMVDLGTLGGTIGSPTDMNDSDHVVGTSNLSGDQSFHPFLWTPQNGMQDLGTLGGPTGTTEWINDEDDIVGKTDLAPSSPQNHDAVLWRHGSQMIDLGTLPGDACSLAYYVNDRGQIVGTSENQTLCALPTGEHAFLWENGGPMVDLNTLVPPNGPLSLVFAFAINNRGEIAGVGVPPGVPPEDYETEGHAFVLIPCSERPYAKGCGDEAGGPGTISQSRVIASTRRYPPSHRSQAVHLSGLAAVHALIARRFHVRNMFPRM